MGAGISRAAAFPAADSFDGSFNFCRGMYTSNRPEAGGQGWWTDYPDADINFSIRLSELTKTRVSKARGDEPNHLVVRLSDDALFQCPYLHMEDVGTMRSATTRSSGCACTCSKAASSGSTISGATRPGNNG